MPSSEVTPDEERTRSQFPSLQQDQVYLDNAGGSQTLGAVVDSISHYLTNTNVQLGASYAIGKKSTAAVREGYEAGARFINAHADEVVFGWSATQLLRNLSIALALKPGSAIVVSRADHEANICPWVDLAERMDLTIEWWDPSPGPDSRLEARDLETILRGCQHRKLDISLVTCTHASNILGTITDVGAVCAVAHRFGALVCVDGVAYTPHRAVDVKALGVDFYVFSWYKVYGPHVSMLYASWSAQRHVRSLGHFFNPSATLDDKLSLAGGGYEMYQSIPRVVDYLGPPGSGKWQSIQDHEQQLQDILLDFLNKTPGVTVYGSTSSSPAERVPTISFTVDSWRPDALVQAVEANSNYALRYGLFYSNRLVRGVLGLGPEGVVRVSMVHYNTGRQCSGFPLRFCRFNMLTAVQWRKCTVSSRH
jgi:cysteine desulfurase family protein (TIGR01976 family)